jgi:hypothetical protein
VARTDAKNRGKASRYREPPLQPLRIPKGWAVEWNTFFDVEPRFKSWDETSWNFKTDMLLLSNEHRGVSINLEWSPAFRAGGAFVLTAVRHVHDPEHGRSGDWDRPLKRVNTRSKRKAVATIEAWLDWYSNYGLSATRRRRV